MPYKKPPEIDLAELGRRGLSLAIDRELTELQEHLEEPLLIRGFYIHRRAASVESEALTEKRFETIFYETADLRQVEVPRGFVGVRVRDRNDLLYTAALREVPEEEPEETEAG